LFAFLPISSMRVEYKWNPGEVYLIRLPEYLGRRTAWLRWEHL
jgi:hypothetical protein